MINGYKYQESIGKWHPVSFVCYIFVVSMLPNGCVRKNDSKYSKMCNRLTLRLPWFREGTMSMSWSNPSRMFWRLFCSEAIWLAFFSASVSNSCGAFRHRLVLVAAFLLLLELSSTGSSAVVVVVVVSVVECCFLFRLVVVFMSCIPSAWANAAAKWSAIVSDAIVLVDQEQ